MKRTSVAVSTRPCAKEFDDAREIVEGLAEEYAACESPDYIKWASGKENERMPGEGSLNPGGRRPAY